MCACGRDKTDTELRCPRGHTEGPKPEAIRPGRKAERFRIAAPRAQLSQHTRLTQPHVTAHALQEAGTISAFEESMFH